MDKLELVADGAVTIREAEALTSLKRSKLYTLMNSGELPYMCFGSRARRIPRRALVELMASALVAGGDDGES